MVNTHRFMIAMLIVVGLAVLSCNGARQIRLDSNSDIPAAEGTIKVSTTENANTMIELVVEHLALPQRVNPAATVYVVWIRGNEAGAQPQNLGALKVDDNLKGSISVVTPLRWFELYITAEPSQMSTMPTSKKLLYKSVEVK